MTIRCILIKFDSYRDKSLSTNESINRFTELVELLCNLQSVYRNHYSINGIQS